MEKSYTATVETEKINNAIFSIVSSFHDGIENGEIDVRWDALPIPGGATMNVRNDIQNGTWSIEVLISASKLLSFVTVSGAATSYMSFLLSDGDINLRKYQEIFYFVNRMVGGCLEGVFDKPLPVIFDSGVEYTLSQNIFPGRYVYFPKEGITGLVKEIWPNEGGWLTVELEERVPPSLSEYADKVGYCRTVVLGFATYGKVWNVC